MLNWINKKRNKKGFTLIELVIVIAILGILIAIAVPRLSGFRDSAAIRADEASAATIVRAAELYYASNDIYNIDLSDLVGEDLIDEDIKPQQEGKEKFTLKYSATNGFEVYYDDDSTPIYP